MGDNKPTFDVKKGELEKAGIIRPISDGAPFARASERVQEGVYHDILLTLYFSRFVYLMGSIRHRTRELGYSGRKEDRHAIINDILTGPSFAKLEELVEKDGKSMKDVNASMAKLMRGKLVLKDHDGDGIVDAPSIYMAQIEGILKDDRYKEVSKQYATELDVMLLHSFQDNRSLEAKHIHLYKFDASNDTMNLVYAIAARKIMVRTNNGEAERMKCKSRDLIVMFRGSVTLSDWLHNVQAPLIAIDIQRRKSVEQNHEEWFLVEQFSYQKIPIEKDLAQKIKEAIGDTPIRVHQGFLSYLFGTTNAKTNTKGEETTTTGLARRTRPSGTTSFRTYGASKYGSIVNDLILLFKAKSDDEIVSNLYITGHSLGAALATLTAFFLACDLTVKAGSKNKFQGFKCVTYASPLTGNISFQRAFDVLRRYKKYKPMTMFSHNEARAYDGDNVRLRHIRITNDRDLVPLAPPLSRYRHTACIHVRLNRFSSCNPFGLPTRNSVHEEYPHGTLWAKHESTFDCPNQSEQKFWDNKENQRGAFPPTSSLSGLCATTLPFLRTISLTAPIILVLIFIMLRATFYNVAALSLCSVFVETLPYCVQDLIYYIFDLVRINLLFIVVLGWTAWVTLAGYPDAEWTRTLIVCVLFPILLTITISVFEEPYAWMNKYLEAVFIVGGMLWQIALFPLRNVSEVFTFRTHALESYYEHIRKDHFELSSYTTIVMTAEKRRKKGEPARQNRDVRTDVAESSVSETTTLLPIG